MNNLIMAAIIGITKNKGWYVELHSIYYILMSDANLQLSLPLGMDLLPQPDINLALLTPRDIWVRLNQRLMLQLGEDRRLEYKRIDNIDFSDLARYYRAFSNTPDGGLLVFGATSKGIAVGCNNLPYATRNKLETFHTRMCPLARPEIKRFEVIIDGVSNFCIAIYIPYISRLVETNRDEAHIRYGDSIHQMSDEEKRDFRSTRQELSFEQEVAPYLFPGKGILLYNSGSYSRDPKAHYILKQKQDGRSSKEK